MDNYNLENSTNNTISRYSIYQQQVNSAVLRQKENEKKVDEFKERLVKFDNVGTIEEAKELASKILPTSNEINRFCVGNAKCVIINREDLFRITLDSENEFITYDYTE